MKNVIIVGKPNVGKSTLFNKLVGKRKALVHPSPGMTRDLISHQFGKWQLIDSGGIDFGEEEFSELIRRQVFYAIEEADLILFLLDGKEGITALDEEISKLLRKKNKRVFLVWNKIDSKEAQNSFPEAYSLGFKDVFI
ncbi:MAG: GTPase [Thermoanaerobaculia bacterium]